MMTLAKVGSEGEFTSRHMITLAKVGSEGEFTSRHMMTLAEGRLVNSPSTDNRRRALPRSMLVAPIFDWLGNFIDADGYQSVDGGCILLFIGTTSCRHN